MPLAASLTPACCVPSPQHPTRPPISSPRFNPAPPARRPPQADSDLRRLADVYSKDPYAPELNDFDALATALAGGALAKYYAAPPALDSCKPARALSASPCPCPAPAC